MKKPLKLSHVSDCLDLAVRTQDRAPGIPLDEKRFSEVRLDSLEIEVDRGESGDFAIIRVVARVPTCIAPEFWRIWNLVINEDDA